MIESLIAVALFCAAPQDTDKETAAREAIRLSRELRAKAKTEADVSKAIQVLASAERHPLIRQELIAQLTPLPPVEARIQAAEGLRTYRLDEAAAAALIRGARDIRSAVPLRVKCLQVFAEVAPSRRAPDLAPLFSDPDFEVAGASVKAARALGRLRLLRSLIELLGELESRRDADDARRRALLAPTREALQELWRKVDEQERPTNYTDANRAFLRRRGEILKLIEEEDRKDDPTR